MKENEIQKEVKEAERKIYLKNIKLIKRFLEGDLTSVKNILTKQMMEKSRSENFEAASQIKAQIARLEYITAPRTPTEKFLENPNLLEDMRREELITNFEVVLVDREIQEKRSFMFHSKMI